MFQNIWTDCYVFSLLSIYDRMGFSSPPVLFSFFFTYAKVQHSVLSYYSFNNHFIWTMPDFLSVMVMSHLFDFILCCG